MSRTIFIAVILVGVVTGEEPARSHRPLRPRQAPSRRPTGQGAAFFVDAKSGNDQSEGNAAAPWRTVRHALDQLRPGDTLYLKSGVYRESVYIARQGKPDAPITIRSAPGASATLDGSWREYADDAANAWEPVAGNIGEFRSKRRHPNIRDVIGSFGDSMIGLQTYYHGKDLRATNELVDWEDWQRTSETDLKPLYCGPGLWYDPLTGHVHARLAHTHLPAPLANYRGVTDPRELPLVIAPFDATVLRLDQAKHIRFQDLELRGGGYATVRLDQCSDIAFENVTIWCGSYGMRISGTRDLRLADCGLYGSVPPWTFRGDTSKRDYPGRPHRNITRLSTHALIDIDNGRESSVFATPQNDRWHFEHCEFTDAHDGIYLGGINVRFHHNLLENLQDDGIYLSPMYFRHRLDKSDPRLLLHDNLFRGMLTALAFGGTETATRDQVFVYRNVFDLRRNVQTGRPSARNASPGLNPGKLIGDHGSPPWSALYAYHNTFVMSGASRDAGMGILTSTRAGHPRRVFNNLFIHLSRMPCYMGADPAQNAVEDGNLYWSPAVDSKVAAALFAKFRKGKMFGDSKKLYAPGSTANSRVSDPQFANFDAANLAQSDFRLRAGSPAIDSGVPIPPDWPGSIHGSDAGKPDLGALPSGVPFPPYGRRKPQ